MRSEKESRSQPHTPRRPSLQSPERVRPDPHPPRFRSPVDGPAPRGSSAPNVQTPDCPDAKNKHVRKCNSTAAPMSNRTANSLPPGQPQSALRASHRGHTRLQSSQKRTSPKRIPPYRASALREPESVPSPAAGIRADRARQRSGHYSSSPERTRRQLAAERPPLPPATYAPSTMQSGER